MDRSFGLGDRIAGQREDVGGYLTGTGKPVGRNIRDLYDHREPRG
jgi:hypothetical protein